MVTIAGSYVYYDGAFSTFIIEVVLTNGIHRVRIKSSILWFFTMCIDVISARVFVIMLSRNEFNT